MSHHQYLFKRYLDEKATPAELEELYQVVKKIDPSNADLFKPLEQGRNIDKLSEEEKIRMEKRFYRILAERDLTWQEDDTIIPISRSLDSIKWWLSAAAAVAALMVGIGWYAFIGPDEATKADQTAMVEVQQAGMVTFQGPDFVRLPDNSTVMLDKGSELSYSSVFGETTREVSLKGEAFFDVAHTSVPFTVRTGKIVTTVLGTAFNVKVSDGVTVTVSRGKVAVGDESHTFDTILPNEQLAVDTKSNEFVKSVVDPETVTQWKLKYFILDKVTFSEAAELISERFNVKVTIANKSLSDCMINAWFLRNEGLEQVMEAVSAFRQATYTIDQDAITIEGGSGCD
jgi:transmembrane sensor